MPDGAQRDDPGPEPRPAGGFAAWLDGMLAALANERDADVPCAGCTACCASSQFVPIDPDETDTLAHVPAELRFPAPRRPPGHVLLGYDARGRCPMLTDAGCSIYEHRPRACRTYDCRIFPATGIAVDDDKPLIAARSSQWRFDHPREEDRRKHAALEHAARTVRDDDDGTTTNTRLAVRALEVYSRQERAGS